MDRCKLDHYSKHFLLVAELFSDLNYKFSECATVKCCLTETTSISLLILIKSTIVRLTRVIATFREACSHSIFNEWYLYACFFNLSGGIKRCLPIVWDKKRTSQWKHSYSVNITCTSKHSCLTTYLFVQRSCKQKNKNMLLHTGVHLKS